MDKNKLQEFTDPDVDVYVVYNKGFHVLYVTRVKERLNLFRKDILLFWKTNLSTVLLCTSLLGFGFSSPATTSCISSQALSRENKRSLLSGGERANNDNPINAK